MGLPATVRTSVSQAAISKVTRLFNGSISDVLNELLQNARRAGATRVDILTLDLAGHPTLSIADDGRGIDDPSLLVTLGASGWDDDTLRCEDPAGMGVFSLAGRRVEIRSHSRAASAGWRIVIPANAWESSAPLAIEPFDIDAGTEILIDMPESWETDLEFKVRNCARYYPLPVTLSGSEVERADFLEGAVYTDDIGGVRIGVFQERDASTRESLINFHGLQVQHRLPIISETRMTWHWRVRVDIIDAPQLQLVLPARKEMVQNGALTALAEHAERAIFRAIAAQPSHRLAFRNWDRARTLGVLLPECEPGLEAWTPVTGNGQRDGGERIRSGTLILMPANEPYIEQSVARALADDATALPGPLVRAESSFEGYSWYDSIPMVADLRFLIRRDDVSYEANGEETLPDDMESGPVDSISLTIALAPSAHCTSVPERITIPAIQMIETRGLFCGVDDVILLWTRDAPLAIEEAVYFMEQACFCYDDDGATDSYDTQLHDFREDACRLAAHLLLSEAQAALHGIERAFQRSIRWLIPEGRTLTITASRDSAELAFAPDAA